VPVPSGPEAVLTKAYTSTVAARTAKIAFSIAETAAGEHITGAGTGAFDWGTGDGTLDLSLSVPPSGQAIALDEVLVPGITYIMVPPSLASAFGTTSPWVKVPVGTGNALSNSPDQVLSLLLKSSAAVTEVGPATVDGVATTEYRASIDPTRADASLPANLRAVADRAVSAAGITSIPLEVYVDGQGRAARISEALSLDLPDPATGSAATPTPGTVSVQVDLTDYGTPVQVTVPPASDVGTSPAISGLLGGTGTTPGAPGAPDQAGLPSEPAPPSNAQPAAS
jgi:hypothetical protein